MNGWIFIYIYVHNLGTRLVLVVQWERIIGVSDRRGKLHANEGQIVERLKYRLGRSSIYQLDLPSHSPSLGIRDIYLYLFES